MPIWQLCANLLIPNCLRSNLSYFPLAALELYVNESNSMSFNFKISGFHIRNQWLLNLILIKYICSDYKCCYDNAIHNLHNTYKAIVERVI